MKREPSSTKLSRRSTTSLSFWKSHRPCGVHSTMTPKTSCSKIPPTTTRRATARRFVERSQASARMTSIPNIDSRRSARVVGGAVSRRWATRSPRPMRGVGCPTGPGVAASPPAAAGAWAAPSLGAGWGAAGVAAASAPAACGASSPACGDGSAAAAGVVSWPRAGVPRPGPAAAARSRSRDPSRVRGRCARIGSPPALAFGSSGPWPLPIAGSERSVEPPQRGRPAGQAACAVGGEGDRVLPRQALPGRDPQPDRSGTTSRPPSR